MVRAASSTKALIIESAIYLFNTKGYDGVSIRDIAKRANVNAANISYYFNGKQGLLEACFIQFFEGYLACIEDEVLLLGHDRPDDCLKRAVVNVLHYQKKYHLLSRFVWRETSIDSQVVREIISSYLMKERFLFKKLVEESMTGRHIQPSFISYFIIQLRSMLTMPFLNSQYLREVWSVFPNEKYFVDKYFLVIQDWLDESILKAPVLEPIHL
jgi:AcrR family transcriptional regulator